MYNITAFQIWLVGQVVKTPPSQGGITSSILVRAAKKLLQILQQFFYSISIYYLKSVQYC